MLTLPFGAGVVVVVAKSRVRTCVDVIVYYLQS